TDSNNVTTSTSNGLLSGDQELSDAQAVGVLVDLYAEGVQRWQDAGIDAAQTAALHNAEILLGNLPEGRLASVEGNLITIDRDAAERGWFVDATPGDDGEFAGIDEHTGEHFAVNGSARWHYDLLTTIMHEQGHILDLDHSFEIADLMYGGLSVGTRKAPTDSDVVLDPVGHDGSIEYLSGGDPYLAGIGMFAGNFDPRGYAGTNGQLLTIGQNSALFSLVGTNYGGDGQTTFGLPDLRGRAVLGTSTTLNEGDMGGAASTTLLVNQLPAHAHEIASPDPRIDLPDGGGDVVLRVDGGDLVVVRDPDGTATELDRIPMATLNSITIEGGDGDDHLRIDLSSGNWIPAGGITFNGNGQATAMGDTLSVEGGAATNARYTFVNENDGSIDLDGSMIIYTGLEPLNFNASATNLILTFTGGTETISITDDGTANDGFSRVDSTLGELFNFQHPTNSLTINSGTGEDTINAIGFDSLNTAFDFIVKAGDEDDIIDFSAFP
ncbi:MAG: tail fiber protein, partial [Planctomycetota bacterium]